MTAMRRETAARVPVVLPLVRIDVGDRQLHVLIDREQYDVPDTWTLLGRGAVHRVVDDITARLGCPVRVQVTETDGSVFTDIVAPRREQPDDAEPKPRMGRSSPAEVIADGFAPDEEVAVAVIVTRQSAGADGTARFRLPPALLANRRAAVVLLGRTSGTVALSDNLA